MSSILPAQHFDYLAEQRDVQRKNQYLNQEQINNIIVTQEINKAFNQYSKDKDIPKFEQRMQTLGSLFGKERLQNFRAPDYMRTRPVLSVDELGNMKPAGNVPYDAVIKSLPIKQKPTMPSESDFRMALAGMRPMSTVMGGDQGVADAYGKIPGATAPAMSMLNGGVGDSSGNAISPDVMDEAVRNDFKKKVSEGDDFTRKAFGLGSRSSTGSSISTLDVNQIPKVTSDEQRAEILGQLPADIAENVQSAGEYRLDATKLYGLRNNSGDRAKFDALVARLYPGWDMKKYGQQQKFINDLAAGKMSQQVTSLNTLAKHLNTFEEEINSLKNTNLKPKNAVINMAKDITGDPSITDFRYAKEIVYGELQRTLTGVGVTQEGMNRVNAMLSENAGISQMQSNVKLLKEIVRGRISPLRTQYKNIMGKEEDGQILFPETKQIFYGGGAKSQNDGAMGVTQGGWGNQQYQIGQEITSRSGRKGKVVGFNAEGKPMIEPIQ